MKRFAVPLLGLAAACQHYAPVPLATTAPLVERDAQDRPLGLDAVVRLALENNPGLKAARAKRGVADAALIQSGILPNPSLAGTFLPLVSGVGVAPAWSVGLSTDIKALVTYRSRRRAARDTTGQAAADLLWQEWQVAGQARQLAADLIATRRQYALAEEAFHILSARNDVMQTALAAGDVTLVTASPTLSASQAARSTLDTIDQHMLLLQHQLDALLGLAPDVTLPLVSVADLPPLDPAAVRDSLATLPRRRPDLLALRLGYAAQEEVVRQAILAQFPDLVLGGSATSDSSKVVNVGPEATVGLPIFDRGQGSIALARATRDQLQAEYAARLATATGEVGAALAEMEQLQRQLAVARSALPAAQLAAERAEVARGQSAIEEAVYVDLITTRFTREQDVMALELALMDRQIALQTLVGAGLPTVDTLPATEAAR